MKEAFTTTARFYFDPETNIMRTVVQEGVRITVQDVDNHHRVMYLLSDGKRFAVLTDARANFTIGSDAKARSAESAAKRIAIAILLNNRLTRLIARIYITINKPECPVKLFLLEPEALSWLNERVRDFEAGRK